MTSGLAPAARVLLIAVARIGDTLLATPVMRALKQACPEGHLTVLAHPRRAEALAHLPFVDRLGAIDKLRAALRGRIGRQAYDAAIVFGRDAALVSYASRVSRRVVAFDEPAFARHRNLMLVAPESGTHAVAERLRLAAALGVAPAGRRLAWHVTDEERRAAVAVLEERWRGARGLLVALQMCSFPTKAQRDWPVARFTELARRIAHDVPDARFMVLGDHHARHAAEPFMAVHGARALLAAGRTSLRQTAALISVSSLYVGVDTGPTHIAGALGVPMVALYHCEFPGRNLVPLDHSLCRMIEHPLTGGDCVNARMEAIGVDEVHGAARDLLAQPLAQTPVPA